MALRRVRSAEILNSLDLTLLPVAGHQVPPGLPLPRSDVHGARGVVLILKRVIAAIVPVSRVSATMLSPVHRGRTGIEGRANRGRHY